MSRSKEEKESLGRVGCAIVCLVLFVPGMFMVVLFLMAYIYEW